MVELAVIGEAVLQVIEHSIPMRHRIEASLIQKVARPIKDALSLLIPRDIPLPNVILLIDLMPLQGLIPQEIRISYMCAWLPLLFSS